MKIEERDTLRGFTVHPHANRPCLVKGCPYVGQLIYPPDGFDQAGNVTTDQRGSLHWVL